MKALILAALLIGFCDEYSIAEDTTLPLVYEEMDAIYIVHIEGETDEYTQVVFVRNNQVIAKRILSEEMIWAVVDGHFQLIWQDYWNAQRVVQTDRIVVCTIDPIPTQNGGQWWAQNNNMRDLKQP